MRLIDADAMAESLEHDVELDARALDSTDLVGPERERVQFDKDCKQNCIWYLTEQPTVHAPRWHRVEVEEPTKAGWYLVMDKDGDFNVEKWDNTFNWLFTTPYEADSITHWMPIEPPKEEE